MAPFGFWGSFNIQPIISAILRGIVNFRALVIPKEIGPQKVREPWIATTSLWEIVATWSGHWDNCWGKIPAVTPGLRGKGTLQAGNIIAYILLPKTVPKPISTGKTAADMQPFFGGPPFIVVLIKPHFFSWTSEKNVWKCTATLHYDDSMQVDKLIPLFHTLLGHGKITSIWRDLQFWCIFWFGSLTTADAGIYSWKWPDVHERVESTCRFYIVNFRW